MMKTPNKLRVKKTFVINYGIESFSEFRTIHTTKMLKHEVDIILEYYSKCDGFFLKINDISTVESKGDP